MVENNVRNHPWKFQVLEKSGSQDIEPSRIWACPGSFRANPIFSRLVHGSDLILHIMIVCNGPDDLGILSLMFSVINYAWLTLFMQKGGFSAIYSRLVHLIGIIGVRLGKFFCRFFQLWLVGKCLNIFPRHHFAYRRPLIPVKTYLLEFWALDWLDIGHNERVSHKYAIQFDNLTQAFRFCRFHCTVSQVRKN